jgi:hypothetical protein
MRTPHPKRRACPVAPHAHPLARQLFEIMDRQQVAMTDVAERAGLSHATLVKWKSSHTPVIATFEAALNVVGYELRIARRRDPSDGVGGRPRKEIM